MLLLVYSKRYAVILLGRHDSSYPRGLSQNDEGQSGPTGQYLKY